MGHGIGRLAVAAAIALLTACGTAPAPTGAEPGQAPVVRQRMTPAEKVDLACSRLPLVEAVLGDQKARTRIPRDRLARYDELVPVVRRGCDDPALRADPVAAWRAIGPQAEVVAALWILDRLE